MKKNEKFSLQTTKWSIQCLFLYSDVNMTVFFQKGYQKMMEQDILENLCNKIVDVVHKTFIKKYYFVKISQSKLGHIFLIIHKKRGRLIDEEKDALHQQILKIAGCVFDWYNRKYTVLSEKYFFEFKLLKDCSGYHFHSFLISCDKYVNCYF